MLRLRPTKGMRIYDQAELIWKILTAFVMFSGERTIPYGKLAKLMGYDAPGAAHTLGRPLGLVGEICLQSELPPLNAIVVTKHGSPGDEVVLRPNSTVKADQDAVHKTDWFRWSAPVAGTFRKLREEAS